MKGLKSEPLTGTIWLTTIARHGGGEYHELNHRKLYGTSINVDSPELFTLEIERDCPFCGTDHGWQASFHLRRDQIAALIELLQQALTYTESEDE